MGFNFHNPNYFLRHSIRISFNPNALLSFSSIYIQTLLFILATSFTGRAQTVTFENVRLPIEFDTYYISDIQQDRKGYLWLATASGLLRYNGYEWITYRHDPNDANSLAGDNIRSICPTRDGMVWVSTWGTGLDCLDPETGKITHHQLVSRKEYNPDENHITMLREDSQGNLWVGAQNGLYRRDAHTGRFAHYPSIANDSSSLSHPQVEIIYEDRQGTLWVGTGAPEGKASMEGGLNRFDPKTGHFTRYLHDPSDVNSLIENRVQVLFEDSRGTFWVGTGEDGLHTMDRKTGRFTRYPYHEDHPEKLSRPYSKLQNMREFDHHNGYGIRFIEEDPTGGIWIGSIDGGANRFDPLTGLVTHYETPADGLPSFNLVSACRSREGVLWMGTMQGHLVKVLSANNPLTRVTAPTGVHFFQEDAAGTLWLATVGGLIPQEPIATDRQSSIGQIVQQTQLQTDHVTRVETDRNGDWWISTWRKGLYRYQPSTNRFIHYQHDSLQPASLSSGEVCGVYQDRSGTHWISTGGGLDRMDNLSGKFTHYRHDPTDSTSISGSSTMMVLEDHTGAFWVGTNSNGLNLLDRASGKFIRFLPWNTITQLLEDAAGTLWVAASSGLYRYDREAKQLLPFLDPGSNMPLPFVRALLEDEANNIWATTPNGIVAINSRRDSLRWFGANYGIPPGEDFFFGSRYKSRDGSLFFGSGQKYFRFRPEELLKSWPTPPMLSLSALRVRNQLVRPQPGGPLQEGFSKAKAIHLSHDQSVFSLDFAAIDNRHPELHRYTYRLENYDLDWRPVGSERTANYYNVPPGAYVFRVKAANSDGVWVEKAINLLISPPWWRTTWAYSLFAFAFAGLFYGGWQSLLRQERQKNQRKLREIRAEQVLEMDHLKSSFFANISHEFRTPLTLIISPLEKKLRTLESDHPDHGDFRMMQRNAQRLLQLVNQLLDLSKMDAGKMTLEKQPGELVQFFRRNTASFTSLAEAKKIHFTIHSPSESLWACFDTDKLEKILNNLLSNAFKFTPVQGEIEVSLRLKKDSTIYKVPVDKGCILAVFCVRDSGIGIPPLQVERIFDRFHQVDQTHNHGQEGSGIGLSLTRELLELHGGTIAVTSELGKGTEFTVTLPLELINSKLLSSVQNISDDLQPMAASHSDQVESIILSTQNDPVQQMPGAIVLIIEDNTDLRHFIAKSLREHAHSTFQVIEAVNGREGYQKALEYIPDLVISDIMMPKMNGMELCQKLKTDEKTSHIPIILLTAKASGESKVEGLETGADDYLTKPFNVGELFQRVSNLIEGRRKLKELYSRQVLLQPKAISITSADERFLNHTLAVIEQHMSLPEFCVDVLGREVGMSRMQLYRKLQALTGQSPSDFIKTIRLKRAANLLIKGSGTVSEIAYQVGFSSHAYFSQCFLKQYGKTPTKFIVEKISLS